MKKMKGQLDIAIPHGVLQVLVLLSLIWQKRRWIIELLTTASEIERRKMSRWLTACVGDLLFLNFELFLGHGVVEAQRGADESTCHEARRLRSLFERLESVLASFGFSFALLSGALDRTYLDQRVFERQCLVGLTNRTTNMSQLVAGKNRRI